MSLPLSHSAIHLMLPDSVRERFMKEESSTSPCQYEPELFMLPEKCRCGVQWKSYNELYSTGIYYTLTFRKSVAVYVRKCTKSVCFHHFDGQTTGVFNYSGETLVSYALMHDFLNSCITGGMSWSSFINKTNAMYNGVYCKQAMSMPFMSQNTFCKVTASWKGYYMGKNLLSIAGSECVHETQPQNHEE